MRIVNRVDGRTRHFLLVWIGLFASLSLLLSIAPMIFRPVDNGNLVLVFTETERGKELIRTHNLRTSLGANYVRDILGFDNYTTTQNVTGWISLSNDATPLSSWTKLPNEVNTGGFTRKAGTVAAWRNGTGFAYNVTATWACTATTTLQAAGLMFSGQALSDNSLYAVAAFTQTTFNYYDASNFDNLTIVWCLTYPV